MKGFDSIWIGPCDLACSIGLIYALNSPDVDEEVEKIMIKEKEAGIGSGLRPGRAQNKKKRYSMDCADQRLGSMMRASCIR